MRLLLLILLLAACTEAPQDGQVIIVKWAKDGKEVRQMCGPSFLEPYGCARQNRSQINPGGSCEIVAIKPKGFDDAAAVNTLGHELLHCLWGPVHS